MASKVLGIGNALVDILITLENDSLLDQFSLPKGSMQLVDQEKSEFIQQNTNTLQKQTVSGGSAANTIHGLAKLGIQTAFIGKTGTDKFGDLYQSDMEQAGIETFIQKSTTSTGIASTLISKDSERTFGTYLGAAVELTQTDLNPEHFQNFDYFYIEGYLVQNHELLLTAAKIAKQNNCKIVLDLASFNVVESNLDFLKSYVKDYVDILFANEEEAKSFTNQNPNEAVHTIANMVDIAVVKLGGDGSLIKQGNNVETVAIEKIDAIDTTGAGDAYAAGFLYGLIQQKNLDTCGRIGSLLGSKVIQQVGARISDELWKEIQQELEH